MRKNILLPLFIALFVGNLFAQQQIEVTGNITANTTWSANNTYLMNGFIRVMPGATLTVEPGTVIYGKIGSKASLIVRQGAKLMAEGTALKPIVFTSEYSKPGSVQEPAAGDWGGIILLGKAKINPTAGTAQIEGTGDPADIYGGTDDEDNSGSLKYVRIEYPGIAYAKDNEINGLTFGAVGRGTTIDYVQVAYSGDDSFEWFGGTVNCKHLIAYCGVDDDFDTDYGYSGKLQYLLGVRHPNIADQAGASNGFESDNDASGSTNSPRTSPTWWNVTMVGPKATPTTAIDAKYGHGLHLRKSSQNKINNILITGWAKDGIFIDGKQTNLDAQSGAMYVKNSIVAGAAKALDTVGSNGAFDITSWFNANNNRYFSANENAMLESPFSLPNPNPMPKAGSPALTGGAIPPNDGFFDPSATYVGAFGAEDWTNSWSTIHKSPATSVNETNLNKVPASYELSQNYPNPFNPATTIRFAIPLAGNVKLSIYNIIGEEVATLVNGFRNAGSYSVNWDASNLSSGIYIYRIDSNTFALAKKMTLVK